MTLQNFYVSLSFFGQCAAAIALFRALLPVLPRAGRQVFLVACSAFFLSRLDGFPNFRLPMGLYLLAALVLGQAIALSAGRTRSILVAIASSAAVAVLAVYKYPHVLTLVGLPGAIPRNISGWHWIGLSYLSFKAIDFFVAMASGKKDHRPGKTGWLYGAAYLTFFPAFVSGPIHRFAPYLANQSADYTRMTWPRFRGNLMRVSIGVIKILFFAELVYQYSPLGAEFPKTGPLPFWMLVQSLYCYYLYLYFDFSGYCDVAIALADFFEVRVIENFNFPLLATSPQDFWNRWHISLSQWLRDMVFFRLLQGILRRWPDTPILAASVPSIFVTFVLMGVWHGNGLNWLLYGCYHGVALSGELLYRAAMERFCPDLYDRLIASRPYRWACVFLMFNFVAWGLLLTEPLADLARLLARIGG